MKIDKIIKSVVVLQVFLLLLSLELGAQEKVLMSTDRDIYIAGEDLWFNIGAYKLSSNEPSKLSQVVYVELINKNKVPVLQFKTRINKSSSQSQVVLPDTLSTGNYSLRAYTRWMENKDLSLFAKKKISIINPFVVRSLPQGDKYFKSDTIFTYPESGILFPNVENKVLIQALNSSGESISVEIHLEDAEVRVLSLKTDSNGLGIFEFTPEKDKIYHYRIGDSRIALPLISDKKMYLQLNKQSNSSTAFEIYGKWESDVSLDIVTKDGQFIKRYSIPYDGVVKIEELKEQTYFALLVNQDKRVLAYRAFSNTEKNAIRPKFKLGKQIHAKRERINLNINGVETLKDISISVVKSCLLNNEWNIQSSSPSNEMLLSRKPPKFLDYVNNKIILPEAEGELVTGKIIDRKSGEPIVGERFMISFVGDSPILKFSITDSLGRFKFVVNRFGEEEMVIQPFSNDTTLLNYKIILDNNFSPYYSEELDEKLILDSINAKEINEAIVNMQINRIYSSFKKKIAIRDSIERLDSFYGKPNFLTVVDKYIELQTVEEIVHEIVPLTEVRKNNGEYYFKIHEGKSLYPREFPTLTMMDGVPIKNFENIFNVAPQDLEKIEVVNLNFYLQDEELGYILSFFSKDKNMADMEFDQRIFRQVHKGFIGNYQYQNPNYCNPEIKHSRLADLRNVLYYNVFSNTNAADSIDVDFYTSDEETEYTIVVKGINENGEFVEERKNFIVSK